MSNQSDFLGANKNRLLAGAAIAANDLITITADGLAFGSADQLQVVDYAVAPAAATAIVAQTAVSNAAIAASNGQAVAQGAEGSIYVLADKDTASGNGCSINRYSASGSVGIPLATLVLSTSAFVLLTPTLLKLTNNTLAAVWSETTSGSTGTLYYAIVDLDLNVIKSKTAIETIQVSGGLAALFAIRLSGGGFAVSYQLKTTATLMRIAIYDNTGTAQGGSPLTFQTFGAASVAQSTMAQLSSGNIVIGTVSGNNTVGSKGLWFTIVTALGVNVPVAAMASTNWALTTTECDYLPGINAFGGYFCMVGSAVSAVLQIGIFSNAGVQQGTTYAGGFNYTGGYGFFNILNDGTDFWLASNTATGVFGVTQLPVTGTNQVITPFAAITLAFLPMSCFIERGYLVGLESFPAANTANKYFVVRLKQNGLSVPQLVVALTTVGSVPGTTGSIYPKIIPGGNFTFIACYDYTNTAKLNFLVTKYLPASIAGVAAGATAKGGTVPLAQGNAGSQPCNYLGGNGPAAFDCTAATVLGPKGQLLNYAIKTVTPG